MKKGSVEKLVENTAEHKKDLHFIDEFGNAQSIEIPAATFDDKGNKVNGWVKIDSKQLDVLRKNAVIDAYFTSVGHLLDSGEVADEDTPVADK